MVLFLLGGVHFLSFPPPLGPAHVPPFFSPRLKLTCAVGAPITVPLPAATGAPSLTRARSKQANPTRLHHGYHSFFPPCTQSFFQPPLPLHRRALATAACITPLPRLCRKAGARHHSTARRSQHTHRSPSPTPDFNFF
jgi:hypothetical protein